MNTSVKNKIDEFFAQYVAASFAKNQIIISPEEDVTSIYLLKKGLVRMYVISEDGLEATIHVFQEGSYFPMMLLLSTSTNKYYFEAMEEVEAIKVPQDKVVAFIKNDSKVLFDLTTRFAGAITGLMNRIEQLVSHGAYSKIVSVLLYLADTSVNKKEDRHMIDLRFSHDQIGTWVGVTRETVSRQMEKLENYGIITQKGHKIIINDLERLKDEVSK